MGESAPKSAPQLHRVPYLPTKCETRPLEHRFEASSATVTGIGVAVASQIVAAGLEYARRNAEVLPIPSNCAPLAPDGEHVRMSAMSAFWMVLPYAMIGIGGAAFSQRDI